MIEPFVPGLVRGSTASGKIVSYGTSSYGYDIRAARTNSRCSLNINSTSSIPKALLILNPSSKSKATTASFRQFPSLARTVEYFPNSARRC